MHDFELVQTVKALYNLDEDLPDFTFLETVVVLAVTLDFLE